MGQSHSAESLHNYLSSVEGVSMFTVEVFVDILVFVNVKMQNSERKRRNISLK